MLETNTLSQDYLKSQRGEITNDEISPGYSALCRQAAAEGIVLLKNDGTLPLTESSKLAVFGRVQNDYFYVGYGSGGDVIAPYKISLMDGLRANPALNFDEELAQIYADWSAQNVPDEGSWGNWPTHFPEMPISEETIQKSAQKSDIALVVIGRSAGEDRESLLEEGSYYLTSAERGLLDSVTSHFQKVVVIIDSGNTMDLSWLEGYGDKISALVYAWQGGMESGRAVADILSGAVAPSGKLTSSIARHYEDYPSAPYFGNKEFNNYVEDIYVGYRYFETFAQDKVLFPFGFGLGYTDFKVETEAVQVSGDTVRIKVQVTNTGNFQGREVVQIYVGAPTGLLGKPAKELVDFQKTTTLLPNASESLTFEIPLSRFASYDDGGKTGHKSAWVLEAGRYDLFVGSSVRDAQLVGSAEVEALRVVEQLQEAAAPAEPFERFVATGKTLAFEPVPTRTISLKERILNNLPKAIPTTNEKYHFSGVVAGKVTLEEFVASLTLEELEALSRGDYVMDSPLGPKGNAGTFGGVTESLREKGVVPVTTTDGPSGIRLAAQCALLPCGTALASTWNLRLLEELAIFKGDEFAQKGSHVLLAPGMNIMRDPLCGRNFEYFSEDPLLTGKTASAIVKGLQTHGLSACPKHFACNNQETNRNRNDSRLSERALREIYLKGFEICIKEANPRNIMTSYNKINGVWGHYHYELCTTILREEWGYTGNVVTDWWMQPAADPDFPNLSNNAYRVRAQVDVLMPGGHSWGATTGDGTLLASHEADAGITLGEMQRTALNVLRFSTLLSEQSA